MKLVFIFSELSLRKKIVLIFSCALLLRFLSYYTHPYISSDSVKYLSINYFDSIGELEKGLALHRQLPPAILYFMRIISSLGIDTELGYRVTSIFLYSFSIFGIFYIARYFLCEKKALFIIFCYAFHPKFIGYSHGVFRESLAIPFMIAGLSLFIMSLDRKSAQLTFLAGICISISYMARLEYGVTFVAALISFIALGSFNILEFGNDKRRILLSSAGLIASMIPLLLLAYINMSHYESEWDPIAYRKMSWFFMRTFD